MSFPGSETENLFRPEAVDPETASFNAKLAATEAALAPFDEIGPVAARARRHEEWLAAGGTPSAMAQDRTVPGPDGPIPVRVLVPETVRGVYLHFHGGGMVL